MSFQIVFVGYIFLSTIFHINNGFYLSLHALEWLNASNYCQSYCNSELVSIHSQDDHLKTLDLIDHNQYIYTRVWLGLNDIKQSDIWEWSDNSHFDFGSNKDNTTGNVIRGTYPWSSSEPDYNNSDQAVVLEVGSNWIETNTRKWGDRPLARNYHFLCNECPGKIHKYAAVNGQWNITEAESICADTFGTSLASIHNANDMKEATIACKQLRNTDGCWIGLIELINNEISTRNYLWSDGTAWDWGTELFKYPWYISEPGITFDQQCVFLDPVNGEDPGEYLWDDYWCYSKEPTAICNAPSEICYKDAFIILEGNADYWLWSKKPCSLTNTQLGKESIAILGNKQYLNINSTLTIDMMYSITSVGLYGSAGIVLYFDKTNCNNYYYIGIWGGHSVIFIGKFINNEWNLIQYTKLTEFNLGIQYLITIELKYGTEWNILFNGQSLIDVSDDEFNNKNNSLSGYIGIINVNVTFDVKSLFISGDVQYEDSNIWYGQCTKTSTNGIIPPINSTISPTTFSPVDNSKESNIIMIILGISMGVVCCILAVFIGMCSRYYMSSRKNKQTKQLELAAVDSIKHDTKKVANDSDDKTNLEEGKQATWYLENHENKEDKNTEPGTVKDGSDSEELYDDHEGKSRPSTAITTPSPGLLLTMGDSKENNDMDNYNDNDNVQDDASYESIEDNEQKQEDNLDSMYEKALNQTKTGDIN